MLIKTGQNVVQVLAVVFTTIVAPVAVNVIVHDLNGEENAPAHAGATIHKTEEAPGGSTRLTSPGQSPTVKGSNAVTVQPEPQIRAVVQSTGRTPDEALQQCLRIALYKAIVAEFGADAWARGGPAIFEDAWRNTGGIIRSWKTLAATKEMRPDGTLYRVEVAIEVDRPALTTRLRAALAGGWRRPTDLVSER